MDDRPRAILSAFANDAGMATAIEAFVVGLAERVDELQDCEAQGALPRLAERAARLAQDAAKTGYEPLCVAIEAVQRACTDRNPQDARKALLELTEVAYRVRLGHRGSV
jgi:hypothetical protein